MFQLRIYGFRDLTSQGDKKDWNRNRVKKYARLIEHPQLTIQGGKKVSIARFFLFRGDIQIDF